MPPVTTPQTHLNLATLSGSSQVGHASNPGTNSISLALLLDFLIQKTYHELTVLAELLPRKMDMERKIEIVKFARSIRQSFVRLLGLVKWASSAAKVDKCAAISAFLDQQSLLFVDTADMLARMSRENLVNARLHNFSLPCAIDVLTTGGYRRLPTCIKERIVPPDPITVIEKASVLQRLNQIIQHRLVTSELPPTLVNLTIAEGRAKFHVPQEFEATLTLMGDDPTIPWRLLNIDILVSDPDTGDGKALVHSMQVNYIHQLIQSRLFSDEKPLTDMYNCLHVFCQSLQLEVLNSQAQRLIRERWGEHVMIEKYAAGQCLTLAYWRAQGFISDGKQEKYTLSVGIDAMDAAKALQVKHEPSLPDEEADYVNQAIRCDRLSIERLLVETVLVRSKIKLQELQTTLQRELIFIKSQIEGTPALLYLPIVEPCSPAEYLTVSVDLQTGVLQPSIAHCETGLLEEIEECLNSDPSKLISLQYIATLRTHISIEHCKQSVQLLPVRCWEKLPLVAISGEHPLNKLSSKRLYIQLIRHSGYYIVVDFKTKGPFQEELEPRYHLMRVRPASFYNQSVGASMDVTSTGDGDTAETYLAPLSLLAIDPKSCVYGPDTFVESKKEPNSYKRKFLSVGGGIKRQRLSTHCEYFQNELSHIVAMCDARIPYITLCEELTVHNIPYQGVQVEAEGVGMVLKLCELPPVEGILPETNKALASSLLECAFRLQPRGHGTWQVLVMFGNCPLHSTVRREQGFTRSVYLGYEAGGIAPVLKHFLQDWKGIGRLYQPFLQLSEILSDPSQPLTQLVEVRSFTYQKLILAYGRDKTNTVTVCVDPRDGRYRLLWGVVGASMAANSHVIVQQQLLQEFNTHQNLVRLVQTLCETQSPMQAICKLPVMPVLGSYQQPHPVQMFCLLPQSSTHIRVVFRNTYCLDIHCKGKFTVSIRDGAYSMFDIMKAVDGFTPAPGLKAFLEMFVDEAMSHYRRRSISEDDNPPSPIPMETSDSFLTTQHSVPSPMTARVAGSGFAHPMTPPTATSNPATPASPHTSVLSQQPYSMSPGPSGYPLASPPSIAAPSPSGVILGTPSPAHAALGAGSPGLPHHAPSPGTLVTVPSPAQMHSPATGQFISPQSITETAHSPFTNMGIAMPSPGTRNWPASPSMPAPSPIQRYGIAHSPGTAMTHSPGSSGIGQQQGTGAAQATNTLGSRPAARILPHRSWAAAVPTLLSHDALHKLFTPALPPGVSGGTSSHMCSPIERFLGCVYLIRKCLNRQLQAHSDSIHLTLVPTNEHGVTQFRSDSLLYRIMQNSSTMQTLQLQVKPHPESKDHWSQDELQVLEKYFETRVGCPPYKYNAMVAFIRLLGAPTRILKDCIQLLRLELLPDRTLKWTVQWCLTIPPSAPPLAPVGTAAVVIKNKILFFVQLTRIGVNVPQGQEPQTVVIPVIHDIQNNTTQQADIPSLRNTTPTSSMANVQNMMKRFNELYTNKAECTIYPAVKDLMANLVIPH